MCNSADDRPPISTYPTIINPLTLPDGLTCGRVIEGMISGTFYSPNYPDHVPNQRCAWVIQVPDGYNDIQFTISSLYPKRRYVTLQMRMCTVFPHALLHIIYLYCTTTSRRFDLDSIAKDFRKVEFS